MMFMNLHNRKLRSSDRASGTDGHPLSGAIRTRYASGIAVRCRFALLLVLVAHLATACNFSDPAKTTEQAKTSNFALIQSELIALSTDTKNYSSRPEIVATDSRVFAIYLKNNIAFDVKLFDSSLYTVMSATTLVTQSEQYGTPTDLRVTQDTRYAYALYESVTTTQTFLWAAKYSLNDTFDLVASTAAPLATSKAVTNLADGEEILNDPAPLLGPNSLFVVTRLMSSLSTTGSMVYRVRELSAQDLSQVAQFDLHLSSVAKGRARVTSLFYYNNTIYMAVPSTVSDVGLVDNRISDDGALSDIILLKMQSDWSFNPLTDTQILSSDTGYIENYVNGFQTDGTFVYMSFKQSYGSATSGEQRAIIKVYDLSFQEILKQTIKKVTWGLGQEIRPSQQIHGRTLYSSQTSNQSDGSGNAEVNVYTISP